VVDEDDDQHRAPEDEGVRSGLRSSSVEKGGAKRGPLVEAGVDAGDVDILLTDTQDRDAQERDGESNEHRNKGVEEERPIRCSR
jgi:hypothetical protein